jgi:hypothetical protein
MHRIGRRHTESQFAARRLLDRSLLNRGLPNRLLLGYGLFRRRLLRGRSAACRGTQLRFRLGSRFFFTAVLEAIVSLLLIISVIWEYAKLLKFIE